MVTVFKMADLISKDYCVGHKGQYKIECFVRRSQREPKLILPVPILCRKPLKSKVLTCSGSSYCVQIVQESRVAPLYV